MSGERARCRCGARALGSLGFRPGAFAPKPLAPYELLSIVDQKRLKCLKLATTYAYDYRTAASNPTYL